MTNVITVENGLQRYENRYGLRRPRIEECVEMGWKSAKAGLPSEVRLAEMNKWCEANIHWSEYRWDHFRVYFRNKQDHLMFLLRWS